MKSGKPLDLLVCHIKIHFILQARGTSDRRSSNFDSILHVETDWSQGPFNGFCDRLVKKEHFENETFPKALFPNDKAFEFLNDLQGKDLSWGRASETN